MASPLQFAYRTQKAIGVFDAAPVYEDLPGFDKPGGNLRCCVYSPCGRYFAYASDEGVSIVDASVGHVLTSLPIPTVYDLSFSPRGSYLSTWERSAMDENGDATKNLLIWRVIEHVEEGAEKQPIGKFVQKSMTNWNLQYTADEQFCARLVTNQVQFYQGDDLTTVWNKLRAEGVTDFAIAPGMNQNVAVFVPERKGQLAGVKVFNMPQFATPISQKTFSRGDKVQLKWNALGTNLIVLAQIEVDKSNKSYYGETNMYLLSVNGSFDARVILDKEGPIHDVAWSPNSKEFAVTYGFTPAKTTLFNHRAVVTHSFSLAPRNTLIFSPTGQFVLVAGFGNLAGQIDVYDLEKDHRKVTTIESGNPSVCTWSPDSRYILTATTSPRLRVDNGVKLWHVTGGIMYNQEMVELYNVMWRPAPLESLPSGDALHPVPAPHASALAYLDTVKTPSKPAGVYRPPGARGTVTPLHFKREDEGGAAYIVGNGTLSVGPSGFGRLRRRILGAEGAAMEEDEGLSKTALKNKKKRNKKAKKGAAPPRAPVTRIAPDSPVFVTPIALVSPVVQVVDPATAANQSANAKKIRGLQKKMRAIKDLEMRYASGEKLEDTQVKKIKTKVDVMKELDVLAKQSA
ncbi:eukaryotic translation initiation factor eIF2A-domain-containing protein [Lasiosphaeria miniovina]|uniref:Eukaryotic translation initiation factor 2A n=1 Tax=Lasiosphaeria miniovina TaxID=1954250 RepID=A0AA39ZTH5_9PEZI|nr:eukaryotic translation initiation factor eIF2A-domain-containing protein [Lasiosphaeria miniovina]KAK0703260.1 eukaryotic translation initiation factor eIF2A-domain-containing protein [Lasiosphaeria miniovina]